MNLNLDVRREDGRAKLKLEVWFRDTMLGYLWLEPSFFKSAVLGNKTVLSWLPPPLPRPYKYLGNETELHVQTVSFCLSVRRDTTTGLIRDFLAVSERDAELLEKYKRGRNSLPFEPI